MPMIGLLLVCIWMFVTLTEKRPSLAKPLMIVAGLWMVLFGWRTFDYGFAWKDTVSMYERVADVDEDNGLAHIGLGFLDAQKGDFESALTHYEVSMKNDPENLVAYTNAAGAYRSLGKPNELAEVLKKMLPHVTQRQLRGDPSTVKVLLFAGREVLPSIDMQLARDILTRLTELVPENADLQALR
jgi:tetratricopeptide (TPR) repeat protein